jgi:CubicO group peptidase (beta-lactamase class C family)
MVGDVRLEQAVRDAVGRAGRRPGLLVVGATDGIDTAVASAGPVPQPQSPPERVVFEIGSVTKAFTALLLAIAVQRGEAMLDDPVSDHLPDGSRVPRRRDAEITLLHLATHASGLPRLPPGLFWHALRHRDDPYARLTPAELLAALESTRLRRAPGDRFRYSNFGAGVLGLALAHTSRVDYETLVRDRITRPLGMTDTVITLDPQQRSRLAPGTRRGGRPAGLWTMPGLAGAGRCARPWPTCSCSCVHSWASCRPTSRGSSLQRSRRPTRSEALMNARQKRSAPSAWGEGTPPFLVVLTPASRSSSPCNRGGRAASGRSGRPRRRGGGRPYHPHRMHRVDPVS